MALYDQLYASSVGAAESGARAGSMGVKLDYMQRLFDIQNRQREEAFATLAQVLGLGSNIWETYKENKGLIKYARERGFEPTGSKISRFFSTPSFEKLGQKYDPSFIYGMQNYEQYGKQMNLLDAISGENLLNEKIQWRNTRNDFEGDL